MRSTPSLRERKNSTGRDAWIAAHGETFFRKPLKQPRAIRTSPLFCRHTLNQRGFKNFARKISTHVALLRGLVFPFSAY